MRWILLVLVVLIYPMYPMDAGVKADSNTRGAEPASPGLAEGPLDGRVFSGHWGPAGKPADLEDSLHFNDGHFSSGVVAALPWQRA